MRWKAHRLPFPKAFFGLQPIFRVHCFCTEGTAREFLSVLVGITASVCTSSINETNARLSEAPNGASPGFFLSCFGFTNFFVVFCLCPMGTAREFPLGSVCITAAVCPSSTMNWMPGWAKRQMPCRPGLDRSCLALQPIFEVCCLCTIGTARKLGMLRCVVPWRWA